METPDFSFFIDDVIREGGIYTRDIPAFTSDASAEPLLRDVAGPAGEWTPPCRQWSPRCRSRPWRTF